jgi:hypothetical protein
MSDILFQFYTELNLIDRAQWISPKLYFAKIFAVGAEVFYVDRSTEYRAENNSRFPQILLTRQKPAYLARKNISLLTFKNRASYI